MEVLIERLEDYYDSTTGVVYIDNIEFSFTLELKWRDNKRNVSCIPPGTYKLTKRYTKERGYHLMVTNVPNRNWILIHSASSINDLLGCIALGYNLGYDIRQKKCTISNSRLAVTDFNARIFKAMEEGQEVTLTIKDKITYGNQASNT